MQQLHAIIIGAIEAWVWGTITGGNGQQIGRFAHLHKVGRGTPPEMQTQEELRNNPWRRNHRRYWYPWQLAPANPLTPLCGRLKSQSRFPRYNASSDHWRVNECPDCRRLADNAGVTPGFADALRREDPWSQITVEQRQVTPDPVSGL
jgi:hypothetical protein